MTIIEIQEHLYTACLLDRDTETVWIATMYRELALEMMEDITPAPQDRRVRSCHA